MSKKTHNENNQQLRTAFAKRLNAALDATNYAAKGKNRNGSLAKEFGVSANAARKWLEGESMPRMSIIESISRKFNVPITHLLYGENSENVVNLHLVKVINLHKINKISCNDSAELAVEHIPAPPNHAEYSIVNASPVIGSAMIGSERAYHPGSYIYWLPTSSASVGDRVIAELPEGSCTFRQLDSDGTALILRPLNQQYPIIALPFVIIGLVIGSFAAE